MCRVDALTGEKMITKVVWKDKMSFIGETETKHKILMDLPEEKGGENKGPKPGELVLVALGGCTGVDMVSILEKMRAKLDGLEMVIKSESQKDHPKVLKNIEIEYILKGENLKEADVKKAIELSLNKYCSVGATLAKCAEISYRWKIING